MRDSKTIKSRWKRYPTGSISKHSSIRSEDRILLTSMKKIIRKNSVKIATSLLLQVALPLSRTVIMKTKKT